MSANVALTYNDIELSVFDEISSSRVLLPAGLVRNGRIIDTTKFSHIINEALALARPKPIKTNTIIVGLPEEQAFIKLIQMPQKLRADELQNALQFDWQNILPISPEQVYYTVSPLKKKTKDKKKGPYQYIVVAYPKDVIDGVVVALNGINIVGKQFVPISFGYASLFSPKDGTSTIILKSDFGNDIMVMITKDFVTRFSTIVHTPVTSPLSIKQLENIRTFYERNVEFEETKVKSLFILPGQFASILQTLTAPFNLATTIPHITQFIRVRKDLGDREFIIPLLGLLRNKFPLRIIPPQLSDTVTRLYQESIIKTVIVYMVTLLSILIYLSLIFIVTLHFNNQNKTKFGPEVAQRLQTQENDIKAEIRTINERIALITQIRSIRTPIASDVDEVIKVASLTKDISITSIARTKASDINILTIEGTTSDVNHVNDFANKLKSVAKFADARIDTPTITDSTFTIRATMNITPAPTPQAQGSQP